MLVEAPADRLGTGAEAVDWLVQRCTAALSAVAVGVVSEALRITAAYTSEREQFGRPIATFQAVGQRVGDAYIDTEAIRLHRPASVLATGPGVGGIDRGGGGQVLGCRWRPAGGNAAHSTSTAAWAWTATTRCGATTCGPSTWSCRWAGLLPSSCASATL